MVTMAATISFEKVYSCRLTVKNTTHFCNLNGSISRGKFDFKINKKEIKSMSEIKKEEDQFPLKGCRDKNRKI